MYIHAERDLFPFAFFEFSLFPFLYWSFLENTRFYITCLHSKFCKLDKHFLASILRLLCSISYFRSSFFQKSRKLCRKAEELEIMLGIKMSLKIVNRICNEPHCFYDSSSREISEIVGKYIKCIQLNLL